MTRWFVLVESNTTGSGRDFCRHARACGVHPVVLVADPARYAYLAEDGIDYRRVDTDDVGAILGAGADLAGVVTGVTSSSDHFIAVAAEVAQRLRLPGPDPEAVRRCRRKDRQRRVLAAAGLPTPEFACVPDPASAGRAAERIGGPVVVKPVTGSGSVGVRLCRDAAEAEAHAAYLLRNARDERGRPVPRRVLVEQYVEGPEFSVETFAGTVVTVVGKHLGSPPWFVETGHDVPAPVAGASAAGLTTAALDAVSALGLGWGPAHTELRLPPGGPPTVIEVNPRLGGGRIPALVDLATGINLVAATVAAAAGMPYPLRRTQSRYASLRFLLAPQPGTVQAVSGMTSARRVSGVVQVGVALTAGDTVDLHHCFRDRVGHVVAVGEDAVTTAAAAESAARLVHIAVDPSAAPSTTTGDHHGLDPCTQPGTADHGPGDAPPLVLR